MITLGELAQWHPTKNDKLPSDFSHGSHSLVWLICSQESHAYETKVRNIPHIGCPECKSLNTA
jgi:hypothetical protein